jgi:hypothetical protein
MSMVVVEGSSLVVILAQWIVSMMHLWSSGCTIPTSIHFNNFARWDEPKIMLRLCCELYCVSCGGHVSDEECYDCVIWSASINMLNVDRWSVWWLLLDLRFYCFFYGRIVMYLLVSQSILVTKSCGSG